MLKFKTNKIHSLTIHNNMEKSIYSKTLCTNVLL